MNTHQYKCCEHFAGEERAYANSCFSREFQLPDGLNFDYLPYGWQQPDTRPLYYKVDTRQMSKDFCRMSPEDYLGESSCDNARWKCVMSSIYPRDDPCQYPPPHQTNTVYKYV